MDDSWVPKFKKAHSASFRIKQTKARKFGPIRCSDCGRFVSVTRQFSHEYECPSGGWRPIFLKPSEIDWVISYKNTNPCQEEELGP